MTPMADTKPLSLSSTQAQSSIPPDFRNDLYTCLLSGNGIRNLEATMTHELQASGFIFELRAYIVHQLRTGQCTTADEVAAAVRAKIKRDSNAAKPNGITNGANGVNGHSNQDDEYTLAIPDHVIAKGARAVRKEIQDICEMTATGADEK